MHAGVCNVKNVQCLFNGNIKVSISFLLNGAHVASFFFFIYIIPGPLKQPSFCLYAHYYQHHSHAIYHLKTHWTVCLSNYEHVYIFLLDTRCARLFLKWKAFQWYCVSNRISRICMEKYTVKQLGSMKMRMSSVNSGCYSLSRFHSSFTTTKTIYLIE